jgi:hypothetical protein
MQMYSSYLGGDNQRLPKMHFLWLPVRTVCLLFSLKNYTYKRRRHPSDSFSSILKMGSECFSETAIVTCQKTFHT